MPCVSGREVSVSQIVDGIEISNIYIMGENDTRVRDLLHQVDDEQGGNDGMVSFVMIGCPVDEGVIRNGGRPGASQAPPLIRKHLSKMTPPADMWDDFAGLLRQGRDLGDVPQAGMEEMQQDLASRVAPWIARKVPVIVLGGGHETTYGHSLAYREAQQPHHILNIDAHCDVRPLNNGQGHSGSPFRQILEDGDNPCLSYHVMGLQPQSVAREHLEYIRSAGGEYAFADRTDTRSVLEKLRKLNGGRDDGSAVLLTLDMDSVDQSQAPGVSAPCASGLSKWVLLETARAAGQNGAVLSLDVVEVNPFFDRDDQTSRLAALVVWYFLLGLCLRKDE
ncbi:MAG: arginase [Balneolaceae bacterium]|nr:MAG: arginase [Balneolaceae bacterium]